MTCQIDALQIDPRYKEGLQMFCEDPANRQACEDICNLAPEELQQKITAIEEQLTNWTEGGVPPELEQMAMAQNPEMATEMGSFLQNEAPQIMEQEREMRGDPAPQPQPTQSFAQGGLAQQGRFGDNTLAHVAPGEMIIPTPVLDQNPGLRQGLGQVLAQSGANPKQFTVGGSATSVNPQTGLPEYGLFSGGGLLGAVIGGGLAVATGGVSLAVGAGLGAAAGTLAGGGSLGDAVLAGGLFYGGASLLAGGGAFGSAAQAGAASWAGGGGLTSAQMLAAESAVGTGGLSGLSSAEIVQAAQPSFAGFGAGPGVEAFGAVKSLPVAGQNMLAPIATEGVATATPSLLSQAGTWIGENKMQAGMLGLMGASALMPEEPMGESTGAEYFNEYDAYTDCIAAGGTQEACSQQHPKGWAEIAPPDKSQWIAGMGNVEPGGSLPPPSGGVPMDAQPWYQQSQQFFAADGGFINGAGTETSDSIPARLSDNEFVLTADAVRGAGNGSVQRGAKKLYDLMDRLERRAT
jgi:hypothetical protein